MGVVAVAVATAALLLSTPPPPTRATAVAPQEPAPVHAVVPLYQEGVGRSADGSATAVPTGSSRAYLPGSRVLDPGPDASTAEVAAARRAASADRAWLAAGTVPGAGSLYEDMTTTALLDLRTLLLDDGALIAGWSTRWRYVWPRDAAFGAVALARTGHVDDAVDVLAFLDRVQAENGSFQARYLPDASGPPDERGLQLDGTGWALWATGEVVAELPAARRAAVLTRLRPLLDRSAQRAVALVAGDGLPPASADYWEVPEARLTLGTVAPLLAGLQRAALLYLELGEPATAASVAEAAGVTARAVAATFADGAYGRYADGTIADAASAFVLPPFVREPMPGALEAWRASAERMSRPAGGLAPGEGWKQDGISWTPQTSLYAWVAATVGDVEAADRWLTWLDLHRTGTGAIPEKVLADGSPAAVAPLAWSAACVLLAVDQLDRAGVQRGRLAPEAR